MDHPRPTVLHDMIKLPQGKHWCHPKNGSGYICSCKIGKEHE